MSTIILNFSHLFHMDNCKYNIFRVVIVYIIILQVFIVRGNPPCSATSTDSMPCNNNDNTNEIYTLANFNARAALISFNLRSASRCWAKILSVTTEPKLENFAPRM